MRIEMKKLRIAECGLRNETKKSVIDLLFRKSEIRNPK